jgi:hypothetical protein
MNGRLKFRVDKRKKLASHLHYERREGLLRIPQGMKVARIRTPGSQISFDIAKSLLLILLVSTSFIFCRVEQTASFDRFIHILSLAILGDGGGYRES